MASISCGSIPSTDSKEGGSFAMRAPLTNKGVMSLRSLTRANSSTSLTSWPLGIEARGFLILGKLGPCQV